MNQSYFYLVALGITCFAYTAQPPLKKRILEQLKKSTDKPNQVPSLQALCGQFIANNFDLYAPYLFSQTDDIDEGTHEIEGIPEKIRDDVITPHLHPIVIDKLWPIHECHYALTNLVRTDSKCLFTPAGDILSIHENDSLAELFRLKEVLKNKFRQHKVLQSENSHIIAATPTMIFVYDNRPDHESLRKYHVPSSTSSPRSFNNRPGRFNYQGLIPLVKRAGETLKHIIPITDNLLYALYNYFDISEIPCQRIYRMTDQGSAICKQLVTDSAKVKTIFKTAQENILAVIFSNSYVQLTDAHLSVLYEFSEFEEEAKVLSSDISPDGNHLAVSFNNGILTLYDLRAHTTKKITYYRPFSPCTALKFYDNEHLLAAHNKIHPNTDNHVIVSIWNMKKIPQRLAHFHQQEHLGCNTIDISPDKEYILLGMKHYDVGVIDLQSFSFKKNLFDINKLYKDPDFFCNLFRKSQLSFSEKLALVSMYIAERNTQHEPLDNLSATLRYELEPDYDLELAGTHL